MLHDLLTEPIVSWRGADRRRHAATLPGILANLSSGALADFPRVRTHQLHPWCMFLTQLAAIALRRAGRPQPPVDELAWREMLVSLTDERHEAWCLVVEDLSQPGFLQPPVPEGTTEGWKRLASPDDIDVLATAKAHDVKRTLMAPNEPESWLFAVVTLQTTEGVYGNGKYGVARMNGGYGSRCRVGYSPDLTLSPRFVRDIDILLSRWDEQSKHGFRDEGIALAWTLAWDGTTSLTAGDLSPHFIEVCRRLRLTGAAGNIEARGTTSSGRRCLPEIEKGDVGDPWIPIDRTKGSALNVGKRGFDYQLLVRLLLSEDFERPAALTLSAADPDTLWFVGSALARDQGGTEGLHERVLPMPGAVRRRLLQPEARALLGRRAEERVASAQVMRSKVLYPALLRVNQGSQDTFDSRVDEVFFEHLFATMEVDDDDARLAWQHRLRDVASAELALATAMCAAPSSQRLRRISEAEGLFLRCLRKHFPDLQSSGRATEGGSGS